MDKITMDDGAWMNLRPPSERMKAGERRLLYQKADEFAADVGQATQSLLMLRHVSAHLIRDWSLECPHPQVVWKDGRPVDYVHMESLDELDYEMENELLIVCKGWMQKITLNFGPSRDPQSPTAA